MVTQYVLLVIALAVLLTVFLIAARFMLCLVASIRVHRYGISVIATMGIITIVAALSMVVVVWFAYAVAHTGKSARTDLIVLVSTVLPFFLASIVLWLLGGKLSDNLRSNENEKFDQVESDAADTPKPKDNRWE